MENHLPPEQRQYLFTQKWTVEIDESFACFLVSAQPHLPLLLEGNQKVQNTLFTLSADMLTKKFDKPYTSLECEDRFQEFRIRHRVMREMITSYGINYCCASGLMWGPKEAWQRVFTDHPISLAYQEMGDPQWSKLQLIFGKVDRETVHPDVERDSNRVMNVEADVDSLKGKKPPFVN